MALKTKKIYKGLYGNYIVIFSNDVRRKFDFLEQAIIAYPSFEVPSLKITQWY